MLVVKLGQIPKEIKEIAALALVRDPAQAAALVQPDRLGLLDALVNPDSAAGLARRLSVPRQRLNYHLRELERVGLVEMVEERRRGNCVERVLRATARAYVLSPEVIGSLGRQADPDVERGQFSFSPLDLVQSAARSIREVSELVARATSSGRRVATLTVDREIRFATPAARAKFAQELAAAMDNLVDKYHDVDAAGGQRCRFVASAYPGPVARPGSLRRPEAQIG